MSMTASWCDGASVPRSVRQLTHSPDIANRLHFLVLKSTIFALSGQATKGFSIALRAASTAARLRLLPTLLEAITALAIILNDLSEFDAARRLLDAALPMVGGASSLYC